MRTDQLLMKMIELDLSRGLAFIEKIEIFKENEDLVESENYIWRETNYLITMIL